MGTNSEEQQQFLDRKEIIGYRPLYNIAKLPLKDQKTAFLKSYANRLTEEELQSDFFHSELKKLQKETGGNYQVAGILRKVLIILLF